MDGAVEQANWTVAQILHTLVASEQQDWAQQLPAIKLALNLSISVSTGFAPFEQHYGWLPRLISVPVVSTPYKGVQQWAEKAAEDLECAFDVIIMSCVNQHEQASSHRQADNPLLEIGSKAYLSTENLALLKGRVGKLTPKYIGLYTIISRNEATSTCTLELPEELKHRRIHLTFHASLLRPHHPNNYTLFPGQEATHYYNFGEELKQEWVVDEIVNHQWDGSHLCLQVQWSTGDTTWERLANCQELEVLD
jgi:hypothetical protein